MNPIKFSFEKFGTTDLIVPIKDDKKETEKIAIQEICKRLEEETVTSLVEQIQRAEREELRKKRRDQKKKGNWSLIKRKVPFYHEVYEKSRRITIREAFNQMLKIIREEPPPLQDNSKGRPRAYDSYKITAALTLKHLFDWSFRDMTNRLQDSRLDLRKDPKYPYPIPSPSLFCKRFQEITEDYWAWVLKRLDQLALQEYVKNFDNPKNNWFVIDATTQTCDRYEVTSRRMTAILRHKTITYNLTSRLVTNTVVKLEFPITGVKSRRNIRDSLQELPSGSTILVDRDYDVESNHQLALERHQDFQCPSKTYKGKPYRGFYRRQNRLSFSPSKYCWRKLGERPFGNVTSRSSSFLPYRSDISLRKGLYLLYIAHNFLSFLMERNWGSIFLPLRG